MAPEEEVQRINELDGRAADELFVRLRIAHHRGGIGMADYAVRHGRDAGVKELAARISRTRRSRSESSRRSAPSSVSLPERSCRPEGTAPANYRR